MARPNVVGYNSLREFDRAARATRAVERLMEPRPKKGPRPPRGGSAPTGNFDANWRFGIVTTELAAAAGPSGGFTDVAPGFGRVQFYKKGQAGPSGTLQQDNDGLEERCGNLYFDAMPTGTAVICLPATLFEDAIQVNWLVIGASCTRKPL